jgi:hypothetical protein
VTAARLRSVAGRVQLPMAAGVLHVTRAIRRAAGFTLLAGACLLVGHNAVYFVELGAGQQLAAELRQAGHAYWPAASALLTVSAIFGVVTAAYRLKRLSDAARGLPDTQHPGPRYLRRVGGLWFRLLAIVAAGFVLQENIEHVLSHEHLPFASVLIGPEHPLASAVLAAVTAVAAAVGAMVGQREARLLARIALTQRPRYRRVARTAVGPPHVARPRPNPIAMALAGRAPPRSVSIQTF